MNMYTMLGVEQGQWTVYSLGFDSIDPSIWVVQCAPCNLEVHKSRVVAFGVYFAILLSLYGVRRQSFIDVSYRRYDRTMIPYS